MLGHWLCCLIWYIGSDSGLSGRAGCSLRTRSRQRRSSVCWRRNPGISPRRKGLSRQDPPTSRQREREKRERDRVEACLFPAGRAADSSLSRGRLHFGQIAAPCGADTCVWPFTGGVVLNPSLSGDSRRQQLNLPGCVLMGSRRKVCGSLFLFSSLLNSECASPFIARKCSCKFALLVEPLWVFVVFFPLRYFLFFFLEKNSKSSKKFAWQLERQRQRKRVWMDDVMSLWKRLSRHSNRNVQYTGHLNMWNYTNQVL